MNEMVERVAQALHKRMAPEVPWTALSAATKALACDVARCGMRVMRDPTFHMERAGGQTLDNASADDVESCWQAMIDAALDGP